MIEGFDNSIGKIPCKDCTNRTPTCHGECPLYSEWRKLNDRTRAKIYKQKYLDRCSK